MGVLIGRFSLGLFIFRFCFWFAHVVVYRGVVDGSDSCWFTYVVVFLWFTCVVVVLWFADKSVFWLWFVYLLICPGCVDGSIFFFFVCLSVLHWFEYVVVSLGLLIDGSSVGLFICRFSFGLFTP